MSTPQIGSFVRTETGEAGYFAGFTRSLYAIRRTDGSTFGVMPQDITVTHVPGFIAEKGGELRYYAVYENARLWAGQAPVAAMVPVGATMHDVFDSLEDFDASKPSTA